MSDTCAHMHTTSCCAIRLNQCVGELNYNYFITFLVTNAAFFYYGATLIFYVLISEVLTCAYALWKWYVIYVCVCTCLWAVDIRKGPAKRHIH